MSQRRPRPRRTRPAGHLALAGLLLAPLSACGVLDGDEDALPVCEVLTTPTPYTIEYQMPSERRRRDGSAAVAIALLFEHVNPQYHLVRVYVQPGVPERTLERIAESVATRNGVQRTRVIDQEETLRDFRRMFAGDEEMIEAIGPRDLPTSVEAVLRERQEADALESWARDQRMVYEVTSTGSHEVMERIAQAFVGERDREQWADLADRLDHLEGNPAWGREGARLLREVLANGLDLTIDDQQARAMDRARTELVEAVRGCPA